MGAEALGKMRSYYFCVVRVVPDPIRDEAINVGVIVVADDSGRGRFRLRSRVKSRIRAIDASYDFDGLSRSLTDFQDSIGIIEQPELGSDAVARVITSRERLQRLSVCLNNQLQMTEPQTYLAPSIEIALGRIFRRYVTAIREPLKSTETMTRSVLKHRIVSAVRKWGTTEIKVEPDRFLRGERATHLADVVISNGRPKAALYAVPTQGQDKVLSYLYRDSFPTIQADMGGRFPIYAILPPRSSFVTDDEREFASETQQVLDQQDGVTATFLDDLDAVRADIVTSLF